MIGGIEETSASFEARSAPRSHPTRSNCCVQESLVGHLRRHGRRPARPLTGVLRPSLGILARPATGCRVGAGPLPFPLPGGSRNFHRWLDPRQVDRYLTDDGNVPNFRKTAARPRAIWQAALRLFPSSCSPPQLFQSFVEPLGAFAYRQPSNCWAYGILPPEHVKDFRRYFRLARCVYRRGAQRRALARAGLWARLWRAPAARFRGYDPRSTDGSADA
jgi:hypothetical protein